MDAGAIYYLGDFRVSNQETLDIKLEVQPEGASTSYPAILRQRFFTE